MRASTLLPDLGYGNTGPGNYGSSPGSSNSYGPTAFLPPYGPPVFYNPQAYNALTSYLPQPSYGQPVYSYPGQPAYATAPTYPAQPAYATAPTYPAQASYQQAPPPTYQQAPPPTYQQAPPPTYQQAPTPTYQPTAGKLILWTKITTKNSLAIFGVWGCINIQNIYIF